MPEEPRTRRRPDECLAEEWLAFLGHRWNALILWHLSGGPKRFSELQQLLPRISPKVLTERLAGLTGRGIVLRDTARGFPRPVTYRLSRQGQELREILAQLYDWVGREGEGNRGGTKSSDRWL